MACQAVFSIAAELRAQIYDDSLSPLPPRQDLLQIEGLSRGLRGDDIPPLLIKAVEEAEEKCLPVLEEMAAVLQTERAGDALPQISMNLTPDTSEDWDFTMSDIFRNLGSMWSTGLFDNEALLAPAIWC